MIICRSKTLQKSIDPKKHLSFTTFMSKQENKLEQFEKKRKSHYCKFLELDHPNFHKSGKFQNRNTSVLIVYLFSDTSVGLGELSHKFLDHFVDGLGLGFYDILFFIGARFAVSSQHGFEVRPVKNTQQSDQEIIQGKQRP